MPEDFADNMNSWQFDKYSFFLQDDNAVAKLLSREWPEFLLLHDVINTSGAGFADLSRYLVIWEYGGIYADIDNTPGPLLKMRQSLLMTWIAFSRLRLLDFQVNTLLWVVLTILQCTWQYK